MLENPRLAVITSKYIIEDGLPILHVSHDDDGFGNFYQILKVQRKMQEL